MWKNFVSPAPKLSPRWKKFSQILENKANLSGIGECGGFVKTSFIDKSENFYPGKRLSLARKQRKYIYNDCISAMALKRKGQPTGKASGKASVSKKKEEENDNDDDSMPGLDEDSDDDDDDDDDDGGQRATASANASSSSSSSSSSKRDTKSEKKVGRKGVSKSSGSRKNRQQMITLDEAQEAAWCSRIGN